MQMFRNSNMPGGSTRMRRASSATSPSSAMPASAANSAANALAKSIDQRASSAGMSISPWQASLMMTARRSRSSSDSA